MRGLLFACLLLVAAPGCQKADTETLARLGRKVADRAQATFAEVCTRLDLTWKMPEPGLADRVKSRLRYDLELSGAAIEVKVDGAQVELTGKLSREDQRRRAVGLAETTTGVERVTDSLLVDAPMLEPPPPPVEPPLEAKKENE